MSKACLLRYSLEYRPNELHEDDLLNLAQLAKDLAAEIERDLIRRYGPRDDWDDPDTRYVTHDGATMEDADEWLLTAERLLNAMSAARSDNTSE